MHRFLATSKSIHYRLASTLILSVISLVSCSTLTDRSPDAPDEVQSERRIFIESAMMNIEQELASRHYPKGAALDVTFLRPFADWDYYYSDGRIRWSPNTGQPYDPVTVPAGFVTDLTSVPRIFWQWLKPEGRYAYAAVVHDYLYWVQTRPRKEADEILKFALEDSKVGGFSRWIIYSSVRLFGQSAWDTNSLLKKQGQRRFLKQLPDDPTISWKVFKNRPNVFSDE